jgi:hypothetical protein
MTLEAQFCTFEIAKRLKQLGCEPACLAHYYERTTHSSSGGNRAIHLMLKGYDEPDDRDMYLLGAPLWQQIEQWLREEHRIKIAIEPVVGSVNYATKLCKPRGGMPLYAEFTGGFVTYEEAREVTITKALESIEYENDNKNKKTNRTQH